ncbi:MAG: polysaccharide biosynthesis protein [Desulfobulbaceae bacterium]|nr:polysaccharide biosynthesis protein [Desulfobulbaceae bacterium]
MLKYHLRKPSFWVILGLDVLLLLAAHLLAYLIRFEGSPGPMEWANIQVVLPVLIPFKIVTFLFFGLYRGMWRYTSLVDLLNILKACVFVSFVSMGAILLFNRFYGYSRAVFVLDGILTFVFVAGSRISLRLFFSLQAGNGQVGARPDGRPRKKIVVIGAGSAAEKIIREVRENLLLPYEILALLDDNRAKLGQRIHGVPVLGSVEQLGEIAGRVDADEVIIAVPSATSEQMARIVELCRDSGLPFKTLPGLDEVMSGQLSIRALRDVSYRDLLGRPPVRLELERIEEVIDGRTVVVTGAGGSIGSELCRQIIRFKPGRLIIFDASEYNLYQIEMELLHELGFRDYLPVLGRVQDQGLLEHLFARYKPAVVFHAAAYKHVPMVENNPWEAVDNNIIATRQLLETAIHHQVHRFILVSTDKAVRPTNVMGASKRMTELLLQDCYRRLGSGELLGFTRLMAVRFGNVIGSSGSVIPLFKRQIEMGGPVTVTDPEMTRYFMSIEEAAQLILQAASMGEGGEIFILKMGTPVVIAKMARDLIRLCGKEPDTEIEIKYVGLRPGEKLYEELITEGEGIVATQHEKIMVLRGDGRETPGLHEQLGRLEGLAARHEGTGIKQILHELIPEYTPGGSEAVL